MDQNTPTTEHHDPMRDDATYKDYLANQLREHGNRLSLIEGNLVVLSVQNDEIKNILILASGFFKFCKYLGVAARWIGGLAMAVLSVWKLAETYLKSKGG